MIGVGDRARAQIFTQLATMERSGLPIVKSVSRMVDRGGMGRRMLGPVLEGLQAGEDVAVAFASSAGITSLEAKVIAAGAKGGSLPQSFKELAEVCEERAKVKVELVTSLAYPILLMHLAVLIPNVVTLVRDGLSAYLSATLIPLGIVYAVIIGGFLWYRATKKTKPELADRLLISIPVLGGIVKKLAISMALKAMTALYKNGVPVLDAVQTAGDVAPNRVVGAAFTRIAERLRTGTDIGEAFAEEYGELPAVVLDSVATGATSGNLDEMLETANKVLETEAKQARKALIAVLGGAAFLFAAAMVAYQVISMWTSIYSGLDQIR